MIREGLPKVSLWPLQLLGSLLDLSVNTFPAVGLAVLEFVFELKVLDGENRKFREMGHRLKRALHTLLAPQYDSSSVQERQESLDPAQQLQQPRDAKESSPEKRSVVKERIILMPSLPTPAPLHGESLLRVLDTANTGFFNIMELPATAVPLGLESSRKESGIRMPVGCQVSLVTVACIAS